MELLGRIARREVSFAAGGQELAYEFNREHAPSAAAGALFFFELASDDNDVLCYSLIKYDY